MFDDVPLVEVVSGLAGTDCSALATPTLVRVMADAAAVVAWAESMVLTAVAELRSRRQQEHLQLCAELGQSGRDSRAADPTEVDRFCAAEVATVLRLSQRAAGDRVSLAVDLGERLPATMREMAAGRLGLPQARTIRDSVAVLDPGTARAVEAQVLPAASRDTASQLASRVRRAVNRADPDAAAARGVEARSARRAQTWGCEDGVAVLQVTGPAETVAAAWARVDALARSSQDSTRRALRVLEAREGLRAESDVDCGVPTLDQLRADTVLRLLAGTHDLTEQSSPHVTIGIDVLVPVGTLVGLDGAPAELAGYGPLPGPVARALATGSTWRRVLTAPDGSVLGACCERGPSARGGSAPDVASAATDRHRAAPTSYRPSAALGDAIRARDVTCRFPGCRRAARGCDIDHTVAHPAGPTAACNLACLCRLHHRVKHRAGWQLEQLRGGVLQWTSPSGRVLRTSPPTYVPRSGDPSAGRTDPARRTSGCSAPEEGEPP